MNEEKFTGKAKTYASSRPSYPDKLIELLYRGYITPDSIVADVGSGTGIFSKLLLERGSTVYCVEPNEEMQKVAEKYLSRYEKCTFVSANAESTSLPDKSVDFITAAQSFHWFDREKFASECKRICKGKPIAALIWNSYDLSADVVKELERINAQCCPDFKGFAGGSKPECGVDGFFEKSTSFRFPSWHAFDSDAFIHRCFSSSYTPSPESVRGKNYEKQITLFFRRHSVNGYLTLPVITVAHIGEVK